MLYDFEQRHNAAEESKNIGCAKCVGAVDHSTITRWPKKFLSGCKDLDGHTKSKRLKIADSEAVLQTIEANLASST